VTRVGCSGGVHLEGYRGSDARAARKEGAEAATTVMTADIFSAVGYYYNPGRNRTSVTENIIYSALRTVTCGKEPGGMSVCSSVDEYFHVKVDQSVFTGIQGRKETLGNPTDNEIRAVIKVIV